MTNPDRVAFTIFGKEIYWYGILMALGIIIAVMLALREAKRKRMKEDTILDLCLIVIPCGIVGARLYYVLFELETYLRDPIRILYLWEGGLAIYGAVIGGLIGALIYARVKKIRFLRLADLVAPGLVLAQGIGRWGNFFNQEAFGPAVTNPSLTWFPFAVRIDRPWSGGYHEFNGVACSDPYHMATFFYESIWCFLIFIFLWARRKKFKHDGDVFLWYILLYSFERMFVEGLRGDSLWLIQPDSVSWLSGGIRVSQLLSALMFIGVVVFFIIRFAREKKAGKLMWPSPLEAVADEQDEVKDEMEDADLVQEPETEQNQSDLIQEEPESITQAQAETQEDPSGDETQDLNDDALEKGN